MEIFKEALDLNNGNGSESKKLGGKGGQGGCSVSLGD